MGSNSKCSKIVRIVGIARVHEGGGTWWVAIVIVSVVSTWWVEWQQ